MAYPRIWVFVRHAESRGNVASAQTWLLIRLAQHLIPKPKHGIDWNLTERGLWQADMTGRYIREHFTPFNACYASTMKRSHQTLERLLPKESYKQLSALNEIPSHPTILLKRAVDILTFLDDILPRHANGIVLTVGHGTWYRLANRLILGCTPEKAVRTLEQAEALDNCAVAVYRSAGPKRDRLVREPNVVVPWQRPDPDSAPLL